MTNHDQKELEDFLLRRQANSRMIELLAQVKERHQLKTGQVTVSKSASYEKIVDSVAEALKENWLTPEQLVEVLDELELAGRQHIMLNRVAASKVSDLARTLASPRNLRGEAADLKEYWQIPDKSFCRLLRSDREFTIVKIVSDRVYHTIETVEQTVDYELFKRLRRIERSAVILKLNQRARLLQIRVPPREHGSAETPKAVYDFVSRLLATHYPGQEILSWLQEYPITDVFPKLINNREDFVLWYDTPQDEEVKASISRRFAGMATPPDLRDTAVWRFKEGYSRKVLRGYWKQDSQYIFVHMNYDALQLDASTKKNVARLFIPARCTDLETDYVIRRIQEHLG